jgi:2-polyprenyl-3-methyl-5-hydroxy-6-metoxy-1,4-benzoquinol methylase
MGFLSTGIDFDKSAVEHGVNFLNINLLEGHISDIKEKFDLITEWMVLEHIHSPFEHIKDIYSSLLNGGVLQVQFQILMVFGLILERSTGT